MDSLISVIIPVYNVEAYLPRCLDSVIQNTYRNLEIICVDDGSTDGSPEILRDYAQRDARITLITKENGGVSSARNAGLDRISGDYIAFVDSDDAIHPQHFEILRGIQKLSGADIAVSQIQRIFDDHDAIEMSDFMLSKNDIELLQYQQATKRATLHLVCTSKLYPSNAIKHVRFLEDFSYGEDMIFCHELLEKNTSITFGVVTHCTYYYFQERNSSLVHSGRDNGVVHLISYLADKSDAIETKPLYFESMLKRARYFRYYYTYVQKNRELAKALNSILRRRIPQLLRSKNYSKKHKLVWTMFMLSPGIDRMHRLYRDPSIKREEAAQKNRM